MSFARRCRRLRRQRRSRQLHRSRPSAAHHSWIVVVIIAAVVHIARAAGVEEEIRRGRIAD